MHVRGMQQVLLCLLLAGMFFAPMATAGSVLYDWSANIDGATYNPPGLPGSVNSAGFDFGTGLGSMILTFDPGTHFGGIYLYIYFDIGFGDVTNAYGAVGGTAPADVTYQLADPNLGVLWTNFSGNALDGSNSVGAYSPPPNACCDVGWALIHAFDVDSGYVGKLTITVSQTQPLTGFYLSNTDYDWGDAVYLTESFKQVPSGGGIIPEPGSWLLVVSGAGLVLLGRGRKSAKRS